MMRSMASQSLLVSRITALDDCFERLTGVVISSRRDASKVGAGNFAA
jgi:hypothetical protein